MAQSNALNSKKLPVIFSALVIVIFVFPSVPVTASFAKIHLLKIIDNHPLLLKITGEGLNDHLKVSWSSDNSCKKTGALKYLSNTSDGRHAVYEIIGTGYLNNVVQLCLAGNPTGLPIGIKKDIDDKERRIRNIEENSSKLIIEGLLIESAEKHPYDDDGLSQIQAEKNATIRIFGTGLTNNTFIGFTDETAKPGTKCDKIKSSEFQIRDINENTALVDIKLPLGSPFYICATQKNQDGTYDYYKHQGVAKYKRISTYKNLLPLWLSIVIMLTCLSFSALFSGLNLGLMAIDRTELKILCNTGTEKEKKYARTIQPVRNHGNYLLCSILFSNVLVNSLFTIILEDMTSGFVAVFCSTLAIVIIGEISPQAICSRHGLCVGAKTIYITKLTMLITFPLSYPISKVLDVLLGEEIGNVYNRERLKELVKVTTGYNDLEKDEVNIIAGALELRKKSVADVMTRIEDCYMLDYNRILDFDTISEIMSSGFSRIPVYEGSRNNIITLLYIKDLAFVDPDDNTPLKTLCQFYQNPCNFVFEDVTLDIMFKQFKEGQKGHMAFVQRVNNEGEGDPFYEVIGLVTLEDVIEELIQAEIIDETDVFTDNRSKRKRQKRSKVPDFTVFAEKKENHRINISPQLTLATFQYLSTSIDAFKPENISDTIFRRLLKQNITYHIKVKSREQARDDPTTVIYLQGKPVDYFVLILEGRVEVTVGKENLMFESGPFTYFGTQALTANFGIAGDSPTNANPHSLGSIQSINLDAIMRYSFIPDYSVRAVSDVFYIKIKRSLYLAAKRASLLERRQKDSLTNQDQYDDEIEKLLHSLGEDDRSVPESPVLPKNSDLKSDSLPNPSPVRHLSLTTSTLPVSANPATNSKFTSKNGKLKNSPAKSLEGTSIVDEAVNLDLDAEILSRQREAAHALSDNKNEEDEEKAILLKKHNSIS